ncbi:MAG: hypothetical protein AB7S99_13785 [Pseudodonghicola sp.]
MPEKMMPLKEILSALPVGACPKSVGQITKETGYPDKKVRNAIDGARKYYAIFNEERGFWRSNDPVPSKASNRWKKAFVG